MSKKKYDLIIIGAGPAGMMASIYASRYGIKHLVIGGIPGGLVTQTHKIGNWLGTESISGMEFVQKAEQHVKSYQTEILNNLVKKIKKDKSSGFEIFLENQEKKETKAIIFAIGTKHRCLEVPGEKELLGKGVSYCATCDGFFYRNKTVAVIGGSDSAVSAALYLADIVQEVYLIYRKEKLRAENFWVEAAEKNPKIKIIYQTKVKKIIGESKVESLELDNQFENLTQIKVEGVFIEIGAVPAIELVEEIGVELDDEGYIKINSDGSTNISGIWSAGDITTGSNKFKQIITASAEGAVAAQSVQKFLKK